MGDARMNLQFFNWADLPSRDQEILIEALRNGSDCVELPWDDEEEYPEEADPVDHEQAGLLGVDLCPAEAALAEPVPEAYLYLPPQPVYAPAQYSPDHHATTVMGQEMVCDFSEQPQPSPAVAHEGMGKRSGNRRGHHRNKGMHHAPRPDLRLPPAVEVLEQMAEPVRHVPIAYAGGQPGYAFPSYPHMYYVCLNTTTQTYYNAAAQGPHALPFVTAVVPSQPHVAMAAAAPSTMAGGTLAAAHFVEPADLSPVSEAAAMPPEIGEPAAEQPSGFEEEGDGEPSESPAETQAEPPAVTPAEAPDEVPSSVPTEEQVPPAAPRPPTPPTVEHISEPAAEEKEEEEEQAAPVGRPVVNGASPPLRSWADLFKKRSAATLGLARDRSPRSLTPASSDTEEEPRAGPPVQESGDAQLRRALHSCTVNHTPPMIQPRGLENGKNWCYMNANLQALLACPAFYNLLWSLPLVPGIPGSKATPLLECL